MGQNRDKIMLTFVYCASILIMVAIENKQTKQKGDTND